MIRVRSHDIDDRSDHNVHNCLASALELPR